VWRTFHLRQRFGFNRTTPGLFLAIWATSLALAVLLGGPLLIATLVSWNGRAAGGGYGRGGLWLAVMFLMAGPGPAFIAPLFNRFSPLEDQAPATHRSAADAPAASPPRGIPSWTTRGARATATPTSPASARHKRIVFFDTLLERLAHRKSRPVLAHEARPFPPEARAPAGCCCRSRSPSWAWRYSAG